MTMKHRKLFPAQTRTNQTQDCSGFCDPACPYNCYSFPDYYFPPPPPSPPIYASDHSSAVNRITPFFIILVTLFIVLFAVMVFYVIKTKCCRRRENGPAPSELDSFDEEDFLVGNQVHHPIWLITTVGLQQSIINSITVCKYKKGEGLIEGTDCSVCFNEFQEDETLRLLPKCNHAFHIPCIDTWLRSHTNCPLCRAGIVTSEAAISSSSSTELGRNQGTHLENSPNDAELINDIQFERPSENRARTGEAQELIDDTISKERRTSVDRNQLNDEVQTVTRSVSIGSALANSSCPGSDDDTETHPHPIDQMDDDSEQNPVNPVKQDDQYIVPQLHNVYT